MEPEITGIAEIKELLDCNQIEVRYCTANDGPCHYRVYEESMKDNFVDDVENPAYGGNPGDAAPHLAQLGW